MKPTKIIIKTEDNVMTEEIMELLHNVSSDDITHARTSSFFEKSLGKTAALRIQQSPLLRDVESISGEELANDHSGMLAYNHLQRHGYEAKPIISMFGREYLLLFTPPLTEGRQRAEVLDITEFDHDSKFTIARSGGYGYVAYEDEGWAVLTVYTSTGILHEFTNPASAVLTYRVEAPTHGDVEQTADEMDDELQNSVDSGVQLRKF